MTKPNGIFRSGEAAARRTGIARWLDSRRDVIAETVGRDVRAVPGRPESIGRRGPGRAVRRQTLPWTRTAYEVPHDRAVSQALADVEGRSDASARRLQAIPTGSESPGSAIQTGTSRQRNLLGFESVSTIEPSESAIATRSCGSGSVRTPTARRSSLRLPPLRQATWPGRLLTGIPMPATLVSVAEAPGRFLAWGCGLDPIGRRRELVAIEDLVRFPIIRRCRRFSPTKAPVVYLR